MNMNSHSKTFMLPGLVCAAIVLFSACRHTNDPEWQHDRPCWTAVDTTDLESTMTVTGMLPASLAAQADTADLVAAFSGDACWGATTVRMVDNRPYFFLFINRPHGVLSEQPVSIDLRYYSTRTKYIHAAPSAFSFSVDTHLGTIASPIVPSFAMEK